MQGCDQHLSVSIVVASVWLSRCSLFAFFSCVRSFVSWFFDLFVGWLLLAVIRLFVFFSCACGCQFVCLVGWLFVSRVGLLLRLSGGCFER